MGLFTRKAPVTDAQLGAANVPGAHSSASVWTGDPGEDSHRDELTAVPDAVNLAGGGRFRLAGVTGATGPATEAEGSNDPGAHVDGGHPNPRQGIGGYALPLDDLAIAGPEVLTNVTEAVGMREQDAPPRPRAGLTGADPARPAVLRLYTFQRLWDKLASDNLAPDGIGKLERSSPLASRPISQSAAVPGAVPAAGGSGPTGMDPVGVQPNSFRILPAAWDELLVNTGPSPAPSARPASRTFRAR